MSKRRVGLFAALIAALAALLFISSGCGGGGKTGGLEKLDAAAILAKAKAAAAKQTSVHVKGDGSSRGEKIAIDMTFDRATGGSGTFETSGITFDITLIGDKLYVKGDEAFYKQLMGAAYTPAMASKLAGKYIGASKSDGRLGSLAGVADMTSFLDQSLTPDGTITKVDGKTIGDVPTVGLRDTKGTTNNGTMYVANDGTDLPMSIESAANSKDSGSLRLDKWGTAGAITAPPADQVIDIKQLTAA